MNEKKFVKLLKNQLKQILSAYSVESGENLLYKLVVDADGNLYPRDWKNPKRGTYAFQTDILIKKNDIPLVVIEVKVGGFSTHDVITYSAKAVKHKEIYPYLRYGLVVGNFRIITNKFFTHNVGLDFAVAIEDATDFSSIFKVVKRQVRDAEQLRKILLEKNRTRVFSSELKTKFF